MDTNAKLSTMTVTVTFSVQITFNLIDTFRQLQLDSFIIGMKYLDTVKGEYSTFKNTKTKRSFNNQICINTSYGIKCKLFGNGTMHFTGAKSITQIKNAVSLVLDKLHCTFSKPNKKLLVLVDNSFYIDCDDYIYSTGSYKVFGYKNKTVYKINNKDYNFRNNFFVEINKCNKKKVVSPVTGEYAGNEQLVLFKGEKVFNDTKIKSNVLFYRDTPLGYYIYPEKYNVIAATATVTNINNWYRGEYSTANENAVITINCVNATFNMGYIVDLPNLEKYLNDLGYFSSYRTGYNGLKFIYKGNNGKCECKNDYSCICPSFVFVIFSSGAVNISGLKTEDINNTISTFKNIISNFTTRE